MKKQNLPVIVLKGIILLPNNDIKIELDEISKILIDTSLLLHDGQILVVSNIDLLEETTTIKDLPKFGVVARITQKLELPNNKIRITLTGIKRVKVIEYLNEVNESLESIVEDVKVPSIDSKEADILRKKLIKELDEYIHEIPYMSNSILSVIDEYQDLDILTDIVISYVGANIERLNMYLNEVNPKKRLIMILEDLSNELESFRIDREIDAIVREKIDINNREFILREKLNQIKRELKETSLKESDVLELTERLNKLSAPKALKSKIENEIRRYETLPSNSPEVSVTRDYIDWLLELPWEEHTIDNDDLNDVRNSLDLSHNGLEEVKTRIVEYLAVKKLTNSLRAPIICLVGPPGVGKTSLAISIAQSMHRKFVKMSVGGISDEAELRGHRRTYIGSNPGRIIKQIRKVKSNNPVFLIDEIDKMLKNYKGDPASVLLEILDPEQNKYFSDNYIEEEFDLSQVMFIATANYLEDIPEALRDRLEIIKLSGYTEYEKLDIAKKHLLPRICREHGLNYNSIVFKDEVILKIIRNYTKEAGVRELDRLLAQVIRKIVASLATSKIKTNKYYINNKNILNYLGKEKYKENNTKTNSVGVVNGLAYTPYGGEVLPIEVNYSKGKGNITLTGSLGNVLKESALVALDYIKANYKTFGIDYKKIHENDIHIHIPEGAVNKDGPSAGIALTTALISALSNLKVDRKLALTGEITLRGNVMAIGGLKEKAIAAHRMGITRVIIPKDNMNDVSELPNSIKEAITFIPVSNYKEIYKIIKE